MLFSILVLQDLFSTKHVATWFLFFQFQLLEVTRNHSMNYFKEKQSTFLSLLTFKVSIPISSYRLFVGVLTMPPVMILNALLCTDSRISSSVSVQLQNTMLPYSRPGRMKEVYIVVKVFLSINFFSFAKIFIFLPAFSLIVFMWSFQDRFVLNSTPRCLCLSTVSSIVLLNVLLKVFYYNTA